MKRAAALLALLLTACGGGQSATPSPSATVAALPSATPPVSFVPVSTPNANPSPAPSARTVTFRDPANGNSLAIEVAITAGDRGHFVFAVAAGIYGGAAPVRATLSSLSAPMTIAYDGPIDFTDAASGATRKVDVSLRGTIDPDAHAADVVLTTEKDRFVITARPPDAGALARTLDRMEAALIADDPVALYAVTNSEVKAQYTQTQFVEAWQAQSASTGRRITAMRRTAIGGVVESDLGYASVDVRYSADITDRNGSRMTGYIAYFVFEDGEWRLWTTSEN